MIYFLFTKKKVKFISLYLLLNLKPNGWHKGRGTIYDFAGARKRDAFRVPLMPLLYALSINIKQILTVSIRIVSDFGLH
jgi:hypothetical protein